MGGERYDHGARVKAIITDVSAQAKGPSIIVSRRSPELIRKLFELEVPEIADGLVEIQNVAREPGYRSKIAVVSHASGVDPVGACVGPRGSRVRMVVSELRGEKIDIIPFNEEPARFVAKALSPARVREVLVDDEAKQATVIVPDDQLSLAIGKDGLNARLAARLTGWRVDIRSETEFAEEEAEMGYEEEEVAGRCAAILANGKRCPNASLPARATAACRPTRSSRARTPTRSRRREDERRRRRRPPRPTRSPAEEPAAEESEPARSPPRPPGEAAERGARREPPSRASRRARGRAGAGRPRPRRRSRSSAGAPLRRLRAIVPEGRAAAAGRSDGGRLEPDPEGRRPGRGAYVCADGRVLPSRGCWRGAGFERSLRRPVTVPPRDPRLHRRMAKKRVHEIAKERGMSSKEVLAMLQEAGFDVKAAASSVDEADVARAFGESSNGGASGGQGRARGRRGAQGRGAHARRADKDQGDKPRPTPARPRRPGARPTRTGPSGRVRRHGSRRAPPPRRHRLAGRAPRPHAAAAAAAAAPRPRPPAPHAVGRARPERAAGARTRGARHADQVRRRPSRRWRSRSGCPPPR